MRVEETSTGALKSVGKIHFFYCTANLACTAPRDRKGQRQGCSLAHRRRCLQNIVGYVGCARYHGSEFVLFRAGIVLGVLTADVVISIFIPVLGYSMDFRSWSTPVLLAALSERPYRSRYVLVIHASLQIAPHCNACKTARTILCPPLFVVVDAAMTTIRTACLLVYAYVLQLHPCVPQTNSPKFGCYRRMYPAFLCPRPNPRYRYVPCTWYLVLPFINEKQHIGRNPTNWYRHKKGVNTEGVP